MRRIAVAGTLFFSTLALGDGRSDGGAQVSVQVADGGDTTFEVTRGELKVRGAGQEVRVGSGQGAEVRRGQPPRKMSLMKAPAELHPADGAHLATVEVSLAWSAVAGARSYHVVVLGDAGAPILDDKTIASARVQVHLPAGSYRWSVRAVDADGLEGRASSLRKLVVDTTPPKLKTGKPTWR